MPRRKSLKPEDVAFLTEWSDQLRKKYENKGKDCTDQQFAEMLDVTRQTLFDYLNGKFMPGLRTIYLAFTNLDIKVRYGNFDTRELVRRGRQKKNSPEGQMLLPFAIESLKPENVHVKIGPKGSSSVDLNLTIKFVS